MAAVAEGDEGWARCLSLDISIVGTRSPARIVGHPNQIVVTFREGFRVLSGGHIIQVLLAGLKRGALRLSLAATIAERSLDFRALVSVVTKIDSRHGQCRCCLPLLLLALTPLVCTANKTRLREIQYSRPKSRRFPRARAERTKGSKRQ